MDFFFRTRFSKCSRCGRDMYPGEPFAVSASGREVHCTHCMGLDVDMYSKRLKRGWLKVMPTFGHRMKEYARKRGKKTEKEMAEISAKARFTNASIQGAKNQKAGRRNALPHG